jgi:hypothetical protein
MAIMAAAIHFAVLVVMVVVVGLLSPTPAPESSAWAEPIMFVLGLPLNILVLTGLLPVSPWTSLIFPLNSLLCGMLTAVIWRKLR